MRRLLLLTHLAAVLALPLARIGRRESLGLCAALALPPRRASADRGKDLYTSDRQLLTGGRGLADDAVLPEFDSEGKIVDAKGYTEDTNFRTISSGPASVQVLKNWVPKGDGLEDPVAGSTASSFKISSSATSLRSIADLGRPEQVSTDALGLEPALRRADLVAARVRQAEGVPVYEFDLALPALECVPELATVCLPSLVVLIAACVRDGTLHMVRIDASPSEWRRAGKALKNLRSTLAVAAS